MLHLDQNHSSLSPPHSKSNLILSGSPRPDQHALLASSWSPPNSRDEHSFYPPPPDQQQSDNTHPQPGTDAPAVTEPNDVQLPDHPSSLGPPSPGHAQDTKPSDPPASASPTEATEPTSPLTPPPDITSPAFPSTELPEGEPTTTTTADTEGGSEAKVEGNTEVDKASRASTPLSELSSAPDAEDPPDDETKAGGGGTPADTSKDAAGAKHSSDGLPKSTEVTNSPLNGHAGVIHAQPAPVIGMVKSESSSGSRAPSVNIATPEPSQDPVNPSQRSDPKIMTVLELNVELLKACMEFQARGIPITDPRAQQYSSRLQNNLGWLATLAEKPNQHNHPLPQMQPPPPLDFLPMDRIQALYTELPVVFAKELRRRSMSAAGPGGLNSNVPNGMLKRERHDDFVGESPSASKRQHTGESRGPSLGPSTPQGAPSPAQSISASMMPPSTPPGSMPPPSLPGPSGSSPSMLPPSVPIGMHGNQSDAQFIAARERAKQMQMRQMSLSAQANMTGDGMRQLSPGSQQGMPNSAGPSGMPNNAQAQMAALNQMGPMGVQVMQALQNPAHQITQYLIQNIPNFHTLPVNAQVGQFMRVQTAMQNRRQAAQAAQSGSSPMGGMQQGVGPQGMMGGNMSGGPMGLPHDSPTRVSPTGQQFPMGSTTGGMSSSNPMSGLTQAQQNSLNNLTPMQRQQIMMMQQHQMRNGNVNPNMLNPQAMNAMQQQQRMMQQMASSSHMGSPMLGGSTDGGNFPPSLRSNPSVPGIARSTRTPSDHSQSPMTPQLSQMGGQRGMNQLQQGGMGQIGGGNMNQAWSQNSPMGQGQGYGMSPPNSAGGFGGMPGNSSSPMGNQQWNQSGQMMFPGGMGNQQLGDGVGLPGSRQTSATPAPQQQLAQNSPMGDGSGLNDFDLFNWSQ